MRYIIVTLLLLVSTVVAGQSLTEQLGGIRTDFTIYFQSEKVDVVDQLIIHRGLSKYNYEEEPIMEYGYGYGYGLQTLRLEVMTRASLATDVRKRRYYYRIVLFDKDGSQLSSLNISQSDLTVIEGDINAYSINLQHIPMILLDHASSVDIEVVE